MRITKRLTAIIASGFALAATPEADPWTKPRRAPLASDPPTASAPPPPQLPEQPVTAAVKPSPVALTSRELIVFASGFALVAAATVGTWMLLESDLPLLTRKPQTAVASPPPAELAPGQSATCPTEPAAAAASEKDGLFPLQASVDGLIAADITSFMAIGNRAAAAGRPRDAEAAFLMSCRVADKLKGAGSVELADAKYHLGSHYARLALDGGAAEADRAELLSRAERLHLESMQATVARYGEAHEKSRLAAEGLAMVRQTLAQGENVRPTPTPSLAPELVVGGGGLQKPPEPALAGTTAALPARPSPATDEVQSRQDPSASKKCPEAVATLGLCTPAN